LFFVMIVVSIAVLVLSIGLARSLLSRLGGWNAASFGVATYVVIIAITQYALPQATKSPSGFPQPSSGTSALPDLACTSFCERLLACCSGHRRNVPSLSQRAGVSGRRSR
jgi:hypothetical protein